jgi:putative transposase
MITRDRPGLSLSRQCGLLSISRSSFYYVLKGESPENLALMRRIDELFLEHPFYGSRQMVRHLRRAGVRAGRHRVRRLMGLEAIYQAPRTSDPHPAHRIYPYLLKGLAIDRPNQVWCADITYVPVQRGFLYLVAIMDWATRHVLAWRLSNTMDAAFCVEALNQAPPNTANRKSSIPTRAASSPASTSPQSSRTRKSPSPWMGGAAAWTISSSNVCGARSNTRRSTCMS